MSATASEPADEVGLAAAVRMRLLLGGDAAGELMDRAMALVATVADLGPELTRLSLAAAGTPAIERAAAIAAEAEVTSSTHPDDLLLLARSDAAFAILSRLQGDAAWALTHAWNAAAAAGWTAEQINGALS